MPWNQEAYEREHTYYLRIHNRTSEVLTVQNITLLNARWKWDVWQLVAGQQLSAGTSTTCALAPRFPPGSRQAMSWSCLLDVTTDQSVVLWPLHFPQSFMVHFGKWVDWNEGIASHDFVSGWSGDWLRPAFGEPVVQAPGQLTPTIKAHTQQRLGVVEVYAVVDVVPTRAHRDLHEGEWWWNVMEARPRPLRD